MCQKLVSFSIRRTPTMLVRPLPPGSRSLRGRKDFSSNLTTSRLRNTSFRPGGPLGPGSDIPYLYSQHLGGRGWWISDLYEFKASLVYRASCKIAKASQRNHVSKKKVTERERKKRERKYISFNPHPVPPEFSFNYSKHS